MREHPLSQRVWEAVRALEQFSVPLVTEVTGVSRRSVSCVFKNLEHIGAIERVGRQGYHLPSQYRMAIDFGPAAPVTSAKIIRRCPDRRPPETKHSRCPSAPPTQPLQQQQPLPQPSALALPTRNRWDALIYSGGAA